MRSLDLNNDEELENVGMYKRISGPGLAALLVLSGLATTAQATLISRLGGQAYYDTVLDITWLANANLAASNTFGVSGISTDGKMTWNTATGAGGWIEGMNNVSYLGFSDWRLPTL